MTRLGVVAAVVAASFFGGSAMAGETGPACTDWDQVDTPSSGKGNHLKSLDALDASNVWAVGHTWNSPGPQETAAGAPMALRWDGSTWTAEPIPVLTHIGTQPTLEAVGIAPTGDPWVVGGIRDAGRRSPLILRWSRGFWETHPVALLNSFAPRYPSLRDVAAIAENDAWVVGEAETMVKGALEPFAAHWDGLAWSEVVVPGTVLGNRVLTAVTAAGPNDVWAVGYDLTGATEPNRTYARIYRWDGRTWSVVKHPAANKPGSALQDIVALAPNDVRAVGAVGTQGLFLHWDGSSWTSHQGPAKADPRSVDGSASDNVWAAGSIENYRWDGATWTAMPTASEAIPQRRAIAVAGPCDAWSISSSIGTAGSASVVQRLVAPAPAQEPPPTPSSLVARPKSGKVIVLEWLPGSDPGVFGTADGFVIERCAGACDKPFAVIRKVSGKLYTFADSDVESGTSYTYRISAVNAAGSSAPTVPVTARTPEADLPTEVPVPGQGTTFGERTIPVPAPPLPRVPPATPVDFTARPKSVEVIVLDWLAGAAPGTARQVDYFVIERCAGEAGVCNEPFAVVQRVSGKLHSIADSGLKPSTSYTYRILAGNAAGLSDPSNPASAKTFTREAPSPLPAPLPAPVPSVTRADTAPADKPAPPATPTALTARAKAKVIVIQWVPGDGPTTPYAQTGFVIERCVGASGACLSPYAIVGKVGGKTFSFVDSGLTPKAYTYRVYAVNEAGSSRPTAPVTAIIRPTGSPLPAAQGTAVLGSR